MVRLYSLIHFHHRSLTSSRFACACQQSAKLLEIGDTNMESLLESAEELLRLVGLDPDPCVLHGANYDDA